MHTRRRDSVSQRDGRFNIARYKELWQRPDMASSGRVGSLRSLHGEKSERLADLGMWYRNCGIKLEWKRSHLSFTHGVNHECQEASQAERRPSGVSSPSRLDSLVSRRVDRGRPGRGREHAAPHGLVGPEIDSIRIRRAGRDRLQFALPGSVGAIDPMVIRSVRPLWVRARQCAGRLRPRPHSPTDRGVANSHLTSAESHLTIALAADRVMIGMGLFRPREVCARPAVPGTLRAESRPSPRS